MPKAVESLTRAERATMSNRFQVAKSRAAKERVSFAWDTIDEYLQDVMSLADEDYSPDTHRVSHTRSELKTGKLGYCLKTMSVTASDKMKKRAIKDESKKEPKTVEALEQRYPDLTAQLVERLMTPSLEGDEKLLDSDYANAKVEFSRHAKRRAKLYNIPESTVEHIIAEAKSHRWRA